MLRAEGSVISANYMQNPLCYNMNIIHIWQLYIFIDYIRTTSLSNNERSVDRRCLKTTGTIAESL